MPDVLAEFVKSGDLLSGRASVTLDVAAPAGGALAQALLHDTPLPPGTVTLGTLTAAVKGNGRLSFGPEPGAAPVTLALGAQAGARLGAYASLAALRADLDPRGDTLVGLDLPASGVARFVAFTSAYALDASAGGPGLALGAGGRVRLDAGARHAGRLIVVRAFAAEPTARAALQSTWDALRLPRQVTSDDSLPPGTWLLAEVDGRLSAALLATFGYDVSWTRRVGLQGLTGDVGLKVQVGLAAGLGWNSEGRFLLSVARESLDPAARVLRLRLARSRREGATLSVKGGVHLTPSTGALLPKDAAEFVAGLLGLHGAHLVADLKAFRGWLDPAQPLPAKLAAFVEAHAVSLAGAARGGALQRARAEIDGLLKSWDKLPHTLSSLMWTELRRGDGMAEIEALARALASTDDAALLARLRALLGQAGFLATPAGRWLSAALGDDLLGALGAGRVPADLRALARAALELLDGKALASLARFAEQHMGLDNLRRLSDAARIQALTPWLRARLSEFIGGEVGLEQLEPLRAALLALDRQAQALFGEAHAALNRTYGFALDAGWSRADTRAALLDAEFDFAASPSPAQALSAALDGDWVELLTAQPPGVRLREAWLTHGLERRRDVRVTLPWFRGSFFDLSKALARLRVSGEGDGLLLYDVEALDEAGREGRWRSRLSLAGRLVVPGARAFGPPESASALRLAYSFRLALDAARAVDLEPTLAPLLEAYFPPRDGAPPSSPGDWALALAASGAPDELGRLALTLDVALPPAIADAWLDAPEDERDPRYLLLSRAVQRALRRVIPACYFQDPARYAAAERDGAAQIVAWSCLPVSTAIALDGPRLERVDLDDDVFWDAASPEQRRAMLSSAATRAALRQRLAAIRARLEARPDLRGFASDWADARLDEVLERAAAARPVDLLTQSLLLPEAQAIRGARAAGVGLARARAAAALDPETALAELARFGAKLTSAFHDALAVPFAGQGANLRSLAALVFFEGARAFGAMGAGTPLARLEVTRLRADAPAGWKHEHLEGRPFVAGQLERAVALLSLAE